MGAKHASDGSASELGRFLYVVLDGLAPDPTLVVAVDDHSRAIVGRLEPQVTVQTVSEGSALTIARDHQNQEYYDLYEQNNLFG